MYMVVDTHAHLNELKDVDKALERAASAGVVAVVAMSMDRESCLQTIQICRKFRGFAYPAVGVHPQTVVEKGNVEQDIRAVRRFVKKCVAVGEVGLDFWYRQARKDEKVRERQMRVFKRMLKIAARYDKPVSIHSRGAWNECLETVKSFGLRKVVFHWFSGPRKVLDEILDLGYYVSATPAVEYSKAHREIIARTPIDNLLLETDTPVKYGSFTAEPADVVRALKAVAKLKGISEAEVADVTTENALKLFEITV